jgi:hypothetical protein
VQQQLMPMSLGLKGMSARLPRCKLGPSQPTPVLYSAVLCCAVLCGVHTVCTNVLNTTQRAALTLTCAEALCTCLPFPNPTRTCNCYECLAQQCFCCQLAAVPFRLGCVRVTGRQKLLPGLYQLFMRNLKKVQQQQ